METFKTPQAHVPRPPPLRVMGAITVAYALLFSCGCGPLTALATTLELSTATLASMWFCTALYVAAFPLGAVGLLKHPFFAGLFYGWALLTCMGEVASVGISIVETPDTWVFAICQLPVFVLWPMIGSALLSWSDAPE